MNEYLISSLEQQLKQDPKSRVFFRLAEEFRKGGDSERAIQVCQEGIQHHPNYVPALVCLGRCHLQLGRRTEAEQIFRQVLTKTPDNPHALNGLASICKESGRHEEAIAYYETLAIQEGTTGTVMEEIEALKQAQRDADPLNPPTDPPPTATEPEPDEPSIETEILEDIEELADIEELEEDDLVEPVDFHHEETETDPSEEVIEVLESPDDTPEPQASTAAVSTAEAGEADDGEEDGEPDAIDLEFEKALQEVTPEEQLLPELTQHAQASPFPSSIESTGSSALNREDEARLTTALKHEKREHLEAAFRIYRNLLKQHPGDEIVLGHLTRVNDSLKTETQQKKKVRILSNWLDKIKGVYYVP